MSGTTTAPAQTRTNNQNGAPRGRRMNRRGGGRGGAAGGGGGRGNNSTSKKDAPGSAADAEAKEKDVAKEEETKAAAAAEEVDDSKICWICAEPVKYFSVSECNHRTCHVCALRLRALYKKLDCTFCKEPQPTVIFTVSADAPFSSYSPNDIPYKDSKLSISFETQEMMEETLILLRFNCPDLTCDYIATGWNDLKLHGRGVHGRLMCDICLRQKKVFSHEHVLYPPNLLPIHLPSVPHRGLKQAPPTQQIEGGIHPLCEFCRECFFGDDELYSHMRERHEECFICKRNEVRDQYFKNYEALEKHFNNAHHPCLNSSCQARKFVVFNSLLDLQAHMVEEHGAEMSSRQQKDARRINAGFEFQDHNVPGSGGRRRPPRDREPPPDSQQPGPGPGSGRQGGGGGGNSRRDRFGGQLTVEGDSSANHSAAPSRRQTPSPPPADMDPVTAERYTGLLARLRSVAPNPTNAVAAVKLSLRSFRASESAPRDLISTVWNILDRDLDNTASIVNILVDILDDEEKKSALLSAWNGFKLEQRRQFPDLVPTSVGTDWAGITGGRVLSAKTVTSTRSSNQTSRSVLDRVAQAAGSSSSSTGPRAGPSSAGPSNGRASAFPALPSSSITSTPIRPTPTPPVVPGSGFRQAQRNTAWSATASGNAPPPPAPTQTQRPVSIPAGPSAQSLRNNGRQAGPQAPPPKLNTSVFPELPSAGQQKVKVTGNNGSLSRILGSTAPTTSAWERSGGGGETSSGRVGNAETNGQESAGSAAAAGGKKKGKGKQKQTLFTLGSFPS
ncbi:uncharacterized protein STEHIDRAFT_51279 [Stereum hirsutum FP-91666 SS1]|uniref:uncharacterized protein n=1 Tax=Stereum hirsutum (strain FP-91666) TaxID=721885 RepID=UPI000440A5ED|nr:uncharacterized protein STEHIDRAFT_51279 [Stereum hirsutum FP-91666 SS1]EIM89639.1 hypothetical protein STEHIDRAFT_51279 [Stereum hirsutum FP-91666 SS1]